MAEKAPFADLSKKEAKETLLKIQTDPVFFAETFLRDFNDPDKPMQLFWYQKTILRSKAPCILLNISRQTGKSSIAEILGIHTATTRKNCQVLIISRSQQQSSELLRKLTRVVMDSEFKNDVISSSTTKLAFKNGSIIVALPTSEATIKGYSPNMVILDEAAMFADDSIFYESIMPMLAATHGRLIIMSTPKGKRGFFWSMYNKWQEDPDSEVYSLPYRINKQAAAQFGLDAARVGTLTCPIHNEEFYKKQADQMPSIKFRQEYGARFVDESDAFFPYKTFIPCMRDKILLYEGNPEKEYYLGIDWGQVQDSTVIVILEYSEDKNNDGRYSVVVLKELKERNYGEALDYVYELNKRFNIMGGLSDLGSGRRQLEELEKKGILVDGIAMSQQSKVEMFDRMLMLMEKRVLTLPHDDELEKQLHGFTYTKGMSGRTLLHHTKGVHDDMVDAIALAIHAAHDERTGACEVFVTPLI